MQATESRRRMAPENQNNNGLAQVAAGSVTDYLIAVTAFSSDRWTPSFLLCFSSGPVAPVAGLKGCIPSKEAREASGYHGRLQSKSRALGGGLRRCK